MSKITVTILGTTAGAPTKERNHPAVHIAYDDGRKTSILFDCGEGTQRQLMKAGINMLDIEAVFITHWHGDHCLGLAGMIDTMGFDGRERPLAVYSPEPGRLKMFLNVTRSFRKFRITPRRAPFRGGPRVLFEDERFTVCSIPVSHAVPSVAYAVIEKEKWNIDPSKAAALGLPAGGKIYAELKQRGAAAFGGRRIKLEEVSSRTGGKKVVYSGDTEMCGNLENIAAGAELLIQDCTYIDEKGPDRPYKHASLPEIKEMAARVGVKKTVLTHFSRRYDSSSELKSRIKDMPGFEAAEDFLEIVV